MLALGHMSHQQAMLNDQNKALVDSERGHQDICKEEEDEG